ncbi:hypothetical protein DFH06DRAFT_98642 [Mycena polygramma]|nr:hypothetical protein DFH06DRAFT_98642 [Mycena polygramma]
MTAAESHHIHDLLLDPNCIHPSYAEIPGIPPNWHESWGILYDTLKTLQEGGYRPYAAISGLLHVEIVREQASALDSSSVDHLKPRLGTNYVPTEDEQKDIKQYVAQGGEKAAELSTLIDADRYRLISSYGRMAALNELMHPYFALASPIRRMPPEILQEIFVACLPTRHFPIMDASCAPLLLGRVCRAWRAISLSTPVLWSAVHVALQGQDPTEEAAGKLRVWLRRSGDCPLFISIASVQRPGDPDLMSIRDIIRAHSRRLKALAISNGSGAVSILDNLTPPDLPLLEVLHISHHSPPTDSHDLQLLAGLPNLHDLSLGYGWSIEASIPPQCSWARFTSLCLESESNFFNLGVSQLMELIAQCINLNNCRLSFPTFNNNALEQISALKPITLAHLWSLSLAGRLELNAGFDPAKILDALELPALRELNLAETHTGVASSSSVSDLLVAINNVVDRSSCALQELSIHSYFGEAQALIQCLLHHGRTLTGLELRRFVTFGVIPDLSPVLAALTNTATPALFPNLRNLCIANFDSTPGFPLIARALIESRCSLVVPGVARLQSVELVLSSYSLPNSGEFAAAMYPSRVIIQEPLAPQLVDRAFGIPDNERDF